jgi:hypothetical protein
VRRNRIRPLLKQRQILRRGRAGFAFRYGQPLWATSAARDADASTWATLIAAVSNAINGRKSRTAPCCAVSVAIALTLSGCGSERDSSRVLETIEAKYGVHVVSCRLDQPAPNDRGAEHWRCDLGSPRTDTQSGVTGTSWCVTNATPDDEFESAHLAYPRSRARRC